MRYNVQRTGSKLKPALACCVYTVENDSVETDGRLFIMDLTPEQKKYIDDRIKKEGLNQFGDPKDTVYAGGSPLFDMRTGKTKDRYEHIVKKHPDWLPKSK
jgi:hypothetical protein